MITKKDYENKEKIEQDKEEFIGYALSKGFDLIDVEDFITNHYENLKSFEYNINKLKEV